ncbi:hypothetical protein FRC17_009651, partial [Serendipita sp. 399]
MDFHLCASNASPPLSSYIFLVPAIFEMSLFGMTLYRAIDDVKNRMVTLGNNSSPSSPLLVVLYRDGFYYFATVFGVYLWIAVAYLTQPIKSTYMGVYFGWAISIVMSCRVYLNLADAVHDRRAVHDTTNNQYTGGAGGSYAASRPPRFNTQNNNNTMTASGNNRHNKNSHILSGTIISTTTMTYKDTDTHVDADGYLHPMQTFDAATTTNNNNNTQHINSHHRPHPFARPDGWNSRAMGPGGPGSGREGDAQELSRHITPVDTF